MSILDIFKTVTPAPKGAEQNPTVPDPSKPGSDGKVAAIPAAGEGEKSPLEGYAKLWENDPNAKEPSDGSVSIESKPEDLLKAAKTIDFSKAISPELMAEAMKDPAKLANVINQAAQAGYAQSAHATTKIVSAALKQQAKMFKEEVLPNILREHSSSQAILSSDNPVFKNPAVAPLVESVRAQVTKHFPTASPAEIAEHTTAMMQGFATELVKASGYTLGKPGAATEGVARKEEDWSKFFGESKVT